MILLRDTPVRRVSAEPDRIVRHDRLLLFYGVARNGVDVVRYRRRFTLRHQNGLWIPQIRSSYATDKK